MSEKLSLERGFEAAITTATALPVSSITFYNDACSDHVLIIKNLQEMSRPHPHLLFFFVGEC
ncbi:MAG: hypothetical protein QF886_27565, partial [Planctomycetota bacterium]|nr:hypothetical protein [Planctomycetota bacterium]